MTGTAPATSRSGDRRSGGSTCRHAASTTGGADPAAEGGDRVIHLRVSTKEQAEEGYSIPAQAEACRRFIADRGWELADEYVDRDESARTADGPQLQAMLARLAEDRSIDCLVIHKLDRLARNLEDHLGRLKDAPSMAPWHAVGG